MVTASRQRRNERSLTTLPTASKKNPQEVVTVPGYRKCKRCGEPTKGHRTYSDGYSDHCLCTVCYNNIEICTDREAHRKRDAVPFLVQVANRRKARA